MLAGRFFGIGESDGWICFFSGHGKRGDGRKKMRSRRQRVPLIAGPIRFFVFEVGFLLLFWFGILRARERLQVPPKPRGYGGA